jgi:hypothetical protein
MKHFFFKNLTRKIVILLLLYFFCQGQEVFAQKGTVSFLSKPDIAQVLEQEKKNIKNEINIYSYTPDSPSFQNAMMRSEYCEVFAEEINIPNQSIETVIRATYTRMLKRLVDDSAEQQDKLIAYQSGFLVKIKN